MRGIWVQWGVWLVFGGAFTACRAEPPPLVRTFYHWETEVRSDSTIRTLLAGHDRLYVKAFDVAWEDGAARPAAEVILTDTTGLPQLVPVVFITNEVMRRTSTAEVATLAEDLSVLLRRLFPDGYPELQLDCDWTATTQDRYFALLTALSERLPDADITCTVRLHQYRDRQTQGVPPVRRATLMAYNTGNLASWEEDNSIVDSTAIAAYLANQPPYPIPLDIAVAVYDWAAVYRRGRLAHLINEPDLDRLRNETFFTRLSPDRYRADSTTYLNGILVYRDDLLRHETAAPDRVDREAAVIRGHVGAFAGQRLLVYRVGSRLWGG